jgi:hypothetical protein
MANRRFIDFPVATTVGDSDIILIWQGGLNKQTTKATILSGLPEDLADLADVNISTLTNGQILRYDSTTGKWINTDQANLDLDDLNDVSIVSPSNGQVLVYNSSTSKWENSSGGFVPYVGAVTTVDLGAQGLRAGYVRFDTTIASVPQEQGIMFWDADDETVDVILNGYTMKIGEDLFYPVKNQTGSTIAKGTAVRFNGTVGASGRLLIAPFIANGSVTSSRFMGVTAEEILDGEDGKVLYFGRIRGINTNAFNEGDILYASTTVAGGFQTAIPVAPNNIVQVAAVVTKSVNQGTIFVRPTIGSNINKDEGVKITSVADKNILQYQSGTALWENKTLAQIIGGNSTQFVKGDGSLDINVLTNNVKSSDTNANLVIGTDSAMGTSLVFTTDFSDRMQIFASGNVRIGSSAYADNGNTLRVGGTIYADSSITTNADINLIGANPFIYGGTAAGGLGLSNVGGQTYIRVFGASHATTPNVTQFVNAASTSLTIASTGAATFNSSVQATQFSSVGGRGTSFGYKLPDWQIYNTSSGNALAFSNYTTDFLTLSSTGAATFGSTITTASPTGSTAQPFKVGSVTTTTDSFFGTVLKMEINGTVYNIMIAEPPL